MTLGNYPIFMPVGAGTGSMQGSPYGMLKGRPIFTTEHASAFSSQGDISLFDLSYYRSITSRGGMQTATSMHLYFDADATAFRTTFRVDGAPKLENPITPPKSTNTTRSPFVTLAAR
jgi:HK97 family phage major capsid protein